MTTPSSIRSSTATSSATSSAASSGTSSASSTSTSGSHSPLRMLRPALVGFVLLSAVTGLLYPALVTGVARTVFPFQAEGSLILKDGQLVGSELIGQNFSSPRYFWGRPSATGPMANNAAGSGGSNQGPTNPALVDVVKSRIEALKAADPGNAAPVPVDLVSASASGLDPHISMAAARYQAARVARERGLPVEAVQRLIQANTEARDLAVLGEPRVHVLKLNLALDKAQPAH
jgi:K+-transporting ATPase ATPase C chain